MVLRWVGAWAAALLIAGTAAVGAVAFVQLSGGRGYATWQDRSSTALRAVGLGPVLDRFENWLYTRSGPPDTAVDPGSILAGTNGNAAPTTLPRPHLPPLSHTADNGGWHPVTRVPGQPPLVYTAVVQPDPAHRGVVVGVALIAAAATQSHLMGGTVQPAHSNYPGQIPSSDVPRVVAAFNSGFKMSDYSGGFFLDGVTVHPLIDGKASAVIDGAGHLTIGQWGRDIQMGSYIRAVRQNLSLIVDHGQVVPGLDRNADRRWGNTRNQLQYTWRSALGVTRSGDTLYVAGDKLNLTTLAAALQQVGAVTGMELDIHSGMEFFSSWSTDGSGSAQPQRLMTAMVGPADRYVRPDQRDFFYVTAAQGRLGG
jgi:hypothetical protein